MPPVAEGDPLAVNKFNSVRGSFVISRPPYWIQWPDNPTAFVSCRIFAAKVCTKLFMHATRLILPAVADHSQTYRAM